MPDPLKIGKYTVIQRIGRGGMGYVYRAHDPILKRDVAIKTMLKEVSDDEDLRSRFLREAQSAGGLRHPNVVTIYDLGEDEQGCPFIAMEFLTGTDLEHIIKNKVELQLLKKIDIIIQTCQGLGYAHANGIVHRDIKVANIRLLDNGEVKIMDFGIAKMTSSHFTRTGMIMGTPHYMAPEQIRGEKVDGRADIFSLGVVLFELLVYRKPFPGDNPTTVLFKIIHDNPEALVDATFVPPEGLEEIVLRAMAKKPEDRYQTCEEFAEDLRYVFGSVQQNEIATGAGSTVAPSHAIRSTGVQLPTMRRTPGTHPPTLHPGLPSKTKTGMTVPSQHPAGETQLGAPVVEPTAKQVPRTGIGAPTYVAPPTQATVRKEPTEMSVGETVLTPGVPVVIRPDLPPITPTPIPSPAKKWLIMGSSGVLGIALIIALIFAVGRKQDVTPVVEPKKPPIDRQVPPPEEKNVGWLVLNIQPWAEILELKDEQGRLVPPACFTTPCRMELDPGKYDVTVSNDQFGTMKIQVEVKRNNTTEFKGTLKGFDYAKAVDSLGL